MYLFQIKYVHLFLQFVVTFVLNFLFHIIVVVVAIAIDLMYFVEIVLLLFEIVMLLIEIVNVGSIGFFCCVLVGSLRSRLGDVHLIFEHLLTLQIREIIFITFAYFLINTKPSKISQSYPSHVLTSYPSILSLSQFPFISP